jgi:hypothetical protein
LWDNAEKNMVERGRPQTTVHVYYGTYKMQFACWETKIMTCNRYCC